MKRRSAALSPFIPVLTLAVICGLSLHISERPWPLCVAALIGCVLVLIAVLLRERLGVLITRAFGERAISRLRSNGMLGTLFFAVVFGLVVWTLWPGSRLWVGYLTLALAAALFGCATLRLHASPPPDAPEKEWVKPARRASGWMGVLLFSILTGLLPGDLVHGVGGASDMGSSEVLAVAAGLKEVVVEDGNRTRDLVKSEHGSTRGAITEEGQQTRDEIGDRLTAQGEQLAAQGEQLARALALLEARESITPSIGVGGDGAPERPPLSDEDRALLDAVKPFADALTRYRIAVAEGDDELAGKLEPEVERLRDEQRAEEDFVFFRAKGDRHIYAGRDDEAIKPYRAALQIKPDEPSVLNNLAVSLLRARRNIGYGAGLVEAESLLARALAVRQRLFPGDHPDVATSLSNLGSARRALSRVEEADSLYEQSLNMFQRVFPGDHPDVATGLNNLGSARRALGRVKEAESLYEQSLNMRQRLFPGDHPDVAMSLNNLGSARRALGRMEEAESLYRRSLVMRIRLYDGDHPDVASSLSNLAGMWDSPDSLADAKTLYTEALEMRRRLYSGDHPDVATSLNNLAYVQAKLGNIVEAETLHVEAFDMCKRLFQGDHHYVAACLSNLAGVRETLGRPVEAEILYTEALEMRQRLYSGDHPDVATSLNNLAYVRASLGKWEEALEPSEQAAAMARRLLPDGHPTLVLYEDNLAVIRDQLGQD